MLFRIGFLAVNWTDVIDILVVTFLFYRLYLIMHGTIAMQIFFGLLLILVGSLVARALNLQAITWILRTLTDIWVIAFIILFQPELRRLLLMLGRGRLMGRIFRQGMTETINEITEACDEMSQRQIGALIVLVRTGGVRMVVETGIEIRAEVTKQLLLSIFNPKGPLHDGAVIIKDRRIEAARCTLPLTAQLQQDGFMMGMRHRSALGISEQADVITVVVSEETGIISVAVEGRLNRRLTTDELRETLLAHLDVNARGVFDAILTRNGETETAVE